MKKTIKLIAAVALAGIVLAGCSSGSAKTTKNEVVKLGVVGANNEVWESVRDPLQEANIELEIVELSD